MGLGQPEPAGSLALEIEFDQHRRLFPYDPRVMAGIDGDNLWRRPIAASQWMSWLQFALSTYLEVHQGEPIAEVGYSVKALRAELQELREELRTHFEKQK